MWGYKFKYFLKWTPRTKRNNPPRSRSSLLKSPLSFKLCSWVRLQHNIEIRDTLAAIDKAVTNREIRTAIRLSRHVRKYRNVIQAHHLLQIVSVLGIEFNENLLKNSKSYDPKFAGTFDLSKSLQAKFSKVLEIEAFVKILII